MRSIIASGFPAERIHLGHRLVGLADKDDRIEAWFENGRRVAVDPLVGADGALCTPRVRRQRAQPPNTGGFG